MRTPGKLLSGMLVGAGVMYLLDPDRGGRRRALLRDQGIRTWHKTEEGIGAAVRDIRNRSAGAAAQVKSRFKSDTADDDVIQERVRSTLGRVVSHSSAIEVTVHQGRVILSGPVLAGERSQLINAVERVRGVTEVEDRLEAHETAEGVAGLQGPARPGRGRRGMLVQENWSPALRVLAGSAGGAALARGILAGGPVGGAAMALGSVLLARAATNLPVKRLLGIGSGRHGVEIHKVINVAAPVERVWELWSNFEDFPRFMSSLREVRKIDGLRSHWTALGPGGIPIEWNAEITEWKPKESIAWTSAEGSVIEQAGSVQFRPRPDGATEVEIRLSYSPPAGGLGQGIASLLGSNPRKVLEEDLVRLKSLLEEGKTSTNEGEVRAEELPGASGTAATW